jgi:hypothetical protein
MYIIVKSKYVKHNNTLITSQCLVFILERTVCITVYYACINCNFHLFHTAKGFLEFIVTESYSSMNIISTSDCDWIEIFETCYLGFLLKHVGSLRVTRGGWIHHMSL